MISKKECKVGHGRGYTLVEIISILKCTEGQGGKYYLGRWSQKWKMECKEGQGRKNWSEVRNARWAGRAGAAGFSQIRRRALIQIRWEAEAQFTSRAWFNQICMMQWFWQSEKLGITRVSHSSVCRYDSVKEGEEHWYARSWITGCQIIYSSRSNYIQCFKSLIFWTYSFSDLSSKKSGHAQGCQACSSVCLAPISLPQLHLDRCWFAAWSLTTLLIFQNYHLSL